MTMDRRVRLARGTTRHMSFRFRPPDPVWAPRAHMENVRAKLRAFDPRVTLWWGGSRGRWRLMEWLNSQGIWSHIVYWQGENGEYRHPEVGSMRALLTRLSGNDRALIEGFEEENAKLERKNRTALSEPGALYLRDMVKKIADMTPRNARRWIKNEATGHHRKFVTEHLTRRWEERNGRRWEGVP